MPGRRSATQLRDHVLQALPDLFSPHEALCAVSAWVLFSSSSFAIRLFNNCLIVYLITPEKSTGQPCIEIQAKDMCSVSSTKRRRRCRNRNFFKRRGSYRIATAGQNCYHKIHKTQEDGGTALMRKRDRNFGNAGCGPACVRRPDRGRRHPAGGFRRVLAVVFDIYRPFMEGADPSPGGHPQILAVVLPIGLGVRHRLSGLLPRHRRGHRRVQHRSLPGCSSA